MTPTTHHLVLDLETTGLPKRGNLPWGKNPHPSELIAYSDARVVQIAWALCDESFAKISEYTDIVVPDTGVHIPDCVVKIHGISQAIAMADGVPFSVVAEKLRVILSVRPAPIIVAHNAAFDVNVLASELMRRGYRDLGEAVYNGASLCTMQRTMHWCGLRCGPGGKFPKPPKLGELYAKVVGKEMIVTHNAQADVESLHRILIGLHAIDPTLMRDHTPSSELLPHV